MTVRLAGSLWSVARSHLDEEALRLARAGLGRWHWDVSDGRFAAPGGFTAQGAARIDALTGLPGEAHLMVEQPLAHLAAWLEACDTIAVHAESERWADAVERILDAGRTAAVAMGPESALDEVADLPPDVGVLLMSIVPGRAGSTFLPSTYERLDRFRGRPLLGVDGSVDLERGHRCIRHGATWLVSGTALSAADDPCGWISAVSAATVTSAGGAGRSTGRAT